jgi:hypothetical protein
MDRWAVFDLMCGSTWLATYECSKFETEMLLNRASSYQQMLETFAKMCELDRSEMINRWSINLPKQPDKFCLSPVDASNWNEQENFSCRLKIGVKSEEEKKHESDSSDSEEESVINLNLILNLPKEKVIKTKFTEKIDDFFDETDRLQRKEKTKVMNAKEYCRCDINANFILTK